MNALINILRALYSRNKLIFLAALVLAVIFVAGCASKSNYSPAANNFVGRGC